MVPINIIMCTSFVFPISLFCDWRYSAPRSPRPIKLPCALIKRYVEERENKYASDERRKKGKLDETEENNKESSIGVVCCARRPPIVIEAHRYKYNT